VVKAFSLPYPEKYQNPQLNRAGNPRSTALPLEPIYLVHDYPSVQVKYN